MTDEELNKKLDKYQSDIKGEIAEYSKGVTNLILKVETHITESQAINEKVADHDDKLYGNGKAGLIKDVDRLTIKGKNQSKLTWLVLAALAPLVIGALWSQLVGSSDQPEPDTTMAAPE